MMFKLSVTRHLKLESVKSKVKKNSPLERTSDDYGKPILVLLHCLTCPMSLNKNWGNISHNIVTIFNQKKRKLLSYITKMEDSSAHREFT